jgi:hypothetical protein
MTIGGFAGCNHEPVKCSTPQKSSFSDESQYVVQSIVSDVAEQIFYAVNHHLPDKGFRVTVTEKTNSPVDNPTYELQVWLDPKKDELRTEINIDGPIWSPSVYKKFAASVAAVIGLNINNAGPINDDTWLSRLTDVKAETIERENQTLSEALENNFRNPELHEKAAVLLGAFALREHSGDFYQIDSPLCRMTAHLIMARSLEGTNSFGINGQIAEAMLLTLMGDEVPALKQLDAIGTNNPVTAPLVRALWTRNTGDYRLLANTAKRSRMESLEWFLAKAHATSTSIAWAGLDDEQRQEIDFLRVASQEGYSVEIGNQLVGASLASESNEIAIVYRLSQHTTKDPNHSISVLNDLPPHCLSESTGDVQVYIIGWGEWAMFFQRHLCNEIHQNFHFLYQGLYDPEGAEEFIADANDRFKELRLYPFVRAINITNAWTQNPMNVAMLTPDAYPIMTATPEIIPAKCWNHYGTAAAWLKHNLLPGTVYDLGSRYEQPEVMDCPLERLGQFQKLAPYDGRVANLIFWRKYGNHPTYDQALELYSNMLPFRVYALRRVAETVTNEVEQYEKLMLQAAALDPRFYYELGDYVLAHFNEDKAADYYDKGCAVDPDGVRVSNHAYWRVDYYLRKGQIEKARQIADDAADVYSAGGLEAKGYFFEYLGNYDEAFKWYVKDEARYDDSRPVIRFCFRYKEKTGNTNYDAELQKRYGNLFPRGMEKVSLDSFHYPPLDGVLIRQENDLVRAAGLHAGDVIVAINGARVHNFTQYVYCRELEKSLVLRLIVWQGNYHEVTASPPNHRFGVDFGNYQIGQ